MTGASMPDDRIDWHDPNALTELFRQHGFKVATTTHDLTIAARSAEDYWARIAAHPLGMATVLILEKASRLTEVRARMFNLIAENWTAPTGEVHLPAQYLLAIAAR